MQDFDNADELVKFIDVLKRYNNNKNVSRSFTNKLTRFFEYKWKNDRNLSIITQLDMDFFKELPDFVQTKIYRDFLF